MADQHLFQLGDKLLLVTIERQEILIDGQVAGYVEMMNDREDRRAQVRLWLYPAFRTFTGSVRRWIERSSVASQPIGTTEIVVYEGETARGESNEPEWQIGFRYDRRMGYEVYLTDRLTGFLYPIHAGRIRRKALEVKKKIEDDLHILSDREFADRWGLQRIPIAEVEAL